MSWKIAVHCDTDPVALRTVRKVVAHVARVEGATESTADSIEVATGEILTNAHNYAYPGTIGPLAVELSYDGDKLQIVVTNHGAPLTAVPQIPDSVPTTRRDGLGLYVVGKLMDEAEIVHPAGAGYGTAVRMAKHLR
jgi:stage II sporulation protein AB (anti-sigma F factor)